MLKRQISLLLLIILLPALSYGQGVLYNEVFPSDKKQTYTEGWNAIFSGDSTNYFTMESNDLSKGIAVNSNPQGNQKGNGYINATGSNLLIYTEEFTTDIEDVKSMKFNSKVSNTTDVMRLTIKIGGEYYVSSNSANQLNTKKVQLNDFGFANSKWSLAFKDSNGGITWSDLSPEVYLPSTGNITGFGVYMENINGEIRIDNFSVMSVPEPALLALLALGALIIYIYRMKYYAETI